MDTTSSFRLRFAVPVIAAMFVALIWSGAVRGDVVFDKTVRPFIEDHCTENFQGGEAKGVISDLVA